MAGLASAHFIYKNIPGAQITVFEKNTSFGGNAVSIDVNNNGKTIPVDIGAQYFTEDTWVEFTTILKRYQLFSADLVYEFKASFVIFNQNSQKPQFISPKGILIRGEKISNLRQFYRFHKAANKLYLSDKPSSESTEQWLKSQHLSEKFITNVAYPFLANSMGVTTEIVKKLSIFEAVKVFAFRGPKEKQKFYILKNGLGNTLNALSDSLSNLGISLKSGVNINSIEKDNNLYRLTNNEQIEEFDFVVFATHPDQAAVLLKDDRDFTELKDILLKFDYTTLNSVLHRDSSFTFLKKPSFLNIITEVETNEYLSGTQNLGQIHDEFNGIYKTWLSDTELARIKESDYFLSSIKFSLPLVSEKFKNALNELYKCSSEFPNLFFAGSWSEGVDNQEKAVISGEKASLKCRKYFDKM